MSTPPSGASVPPSIDAAHLARQREWSARTFGPGLRTKGVLDHIRKELAEIEADPHDVTEWIDVVILALDGAWRHGAEPQQIIDTIRAKQARNEARTWPDWRLASEDQAIEHDRTGESRVRALRPDGQTQDGCEYQHYIGSNETTDEWCLTHDQRLAKCASGDSTTPGEPS